MSVPAEGHYSMPKLAILFWFYKDLHTCKSRLKQLRQLNPGTAIFGLYGGDAANEGEARRQLGSFFDDFYAFSEDRSAHWKWQHGDRLIAAWHRDRGHALNWETIILVQWDMLILESISKAFSTLRRDEVLFSGLRPQSEVADWWGWVSGKDLEKANDMRAFLDHTRDRYGYSGTLWCCLFIIVCLPRRFLNLYVEAGPPEEGFLEYKMPTMARIFGIPACTNHPYQPWWASDPSTRSAPARSRTLNAVGQDVAFQTILEEAATRGGRRIFHPYRQPAPLWLTYRPLAKIMLAYSRLNTAEATTP
ncbi:hypothetical protein [Azospirillum sp. sgz301742]